MNVTLYYFSGTGNSLFIAKQIHNIFIEKDNNHQVNIIPIQSLDLNYNLIDNSDIVGIIYPTYFLDAPDIVKTFANKLTVENDTYLFLYVNYGGTAGNALYNMDKLIGSEKVNAHYEVALPDNSIVFETKNEKIPSMLNDGKQKILEDAKAIYSKKTTLKSKKNIPFKLVRKIIKQFCVVYMGFDKMYVNTNVCNGCKLCSQVCPMKNVTINDLKFPSFGKNCSMCFACLHHCPKEAIRFKKMSKKKENFRYTHPEISVKEIINANIK